MKSKSALTIIALAAVLSISLAGTAQNVINFNGLPHTGAPLPIPYGYAGMNWGSLNYVTELLKNGIQNVAVPDFNSFAQTISPAQPDVPYQLIGMSVTGQYNTTLTIYAYTQGRFVGSQSYPLTPNLTPIRLPGEWGSITQVTLVCRDSQQKPAFYNLLSLTLP